MELCLESNSDLEIFEKTMHQDVKFKIGSSVECRVIRKKSVVTRSSSNDHLVKLQPVPSPSSSISVNNGLHHLRVNDISITPIRKGRGGQRKRIVRKSVDKKVLQPNLRPEWCIVEPEPPEPEVIDVSSDSDDNVDPLQLSPTQAHGIRQEPQESMEQVSIVHDTTDLQVSTNDTIKTDSLPIRLISEPKDIEPPLILGVTSDLSQISLNSEDVTLPPLTSVSSNCDTNENPLNSSNTDTSPDPSLSSLNVENEFIPVPETVTPDLLTSDLNIKSDLPSLSSDFKIDTSPDPNLSSLTVENEFIPVPETVTPDLLTSDLNIKSDPPNLSSDFKIDTQQVSLSPNCDVNKEPSNVSLNFECTTKQVDVGSISDNTAIENGTSSTLDDEQIEVSETAKTIEPELDAQDKLESIQVNSNCDCDQTDVPVLQDDVSSNCGVPQEEDNATTPKSEVVLQPVPEKSTEEYECPPCKIVLNRKEVTKYYNKDTQSYKYEGCCVTKKKTSRKEEKIFECNICFKKMARLSYIRKHMASIHCDERPFSCHLCDKTFKLEDNLNNHLSSNHLYIKPHNFKKYCNSNENGHICHVCSSKFNSQFALNIHLNSVHKIKQEIISLNLNCENNDDCENTEDSDDISNIENETRYCSICKRYYLKRSSLVHHLKLRHNIIIDTPPKIVTTPKIKPGKIKPVPVVRIKKPTHCKLCNFVGKRHNRLRQHLVTHFSIFPYKCLHCEMKYKNLSYLKIHMKAVHKIVNNAPFDTDWEAVIEQNELSDHLNDYKYYCVVCKLYFNDPLKLEEHMNKYYKYVQIFKCDHCLYISKKKEKFTAHIQNNHLNYYENSLLSCKICKISFKFLKEFQIHQIKYHSSDLETKKVTLTFEKDKYNCSECKRVFINVRNANSHLHKHSLNLKEKYTRLCKVCNIMFKSIKNLELHNNTVHNPQNRCKFTKENLNLRSIDGMYVCKKCENIFETKISVLQHISEKHVDSSLPNCDICKYISPNSHDIKLHMKAHIKHPICHKCKLKCKSIEELIQHNNEIHKNVPINIKTEAVEEHSENIVDDKINPSSNCVKEIKVEYMDDNSNTEMPKLEPLEPDMPILIDCDSGSNIIIDVITETREENEMPNLIPVTVNNEMPVLTPVENISNKKRKKPLPKLLPIHSKSYKKSKKNNDTVCISIPENSDNDSKDCLQLMLQNFKEGCSFDNTVNDSSEIQNEQCSVPNIKHEIIDEAIEISNNQELNNMETSKLLSDSEMSNIKDTTLDIQPLTGSVDTCKSQEIHTKIPKLECALDINNEISVNEIHEPSDMSNAIANSVQNVCGTSTAESTDNQVLRTISESHELSEMCDISNVPNPSLSSLQNVGDTSIVERSDHQVLHTISESHEPSEMSDIRNVPSLSSVQTVGDTSIVERSDHQVLHTISESLKPNEMSNIPDMSSPSLSSRQNIDESLTVKRSDHQVLHTISESHEQSEMSDIHDVSSLISLQNVDETSTAERSDHQMLHTISEVSKSIPIVADNIQHIPEICEVTVSESSDIYKLLNSVEVSTNQVPHEELNAMIDNCTSSNKNIDDSDDTDDNLQYILFGYDCLLCNIEFDLLEDLISHKMNVHKNESRLRVEHLGVLKEEKTTKKQLNCEHCEYNTVNIKELETHMINHTKNIHQCTSCNDSFKYISQLTLHEFEHQYSNSESYIKELKSSVQDMPKFKTIICSESVLGKNIERKIEQFDCNTCIYKTTELHSYTLHIKSHKLNEIKCKDCNLLFNNENDLAVHENNIHKIIKNIKLELNEDISIKFNFECKECNQKFCSKLSLNHHLKRTHNMLQCQSCLYLAIDTMQLQSHLEITTSESHVCSRCNFTCISQCHLYQHRNSHKNEEIKHLVKIENTTSECKECDYTASNNEDLQLHVNSVHNMTSFQYMCPVCSKTFKTPELLLLHENDEHKVEVMYEHIITVENSCDEIIDISQCYECKENFKSKIELESHILNIHNLICEKCEFNTVNVYEFKSHCSTHPELCFYECLNCTSKFCSVKDLHLHNEKLHAYRPPSNEIKSLLFSPKTIKKTNIKNTSTKCIFCEKLFPKKSLWKTHYIEEHKNKNAKCRICSYVVKPPNVLRAMIAHQKTHKSVNENTEDANNSDEMFYCGPCNKTFKFQWKLRLHLVSVNHLIKSQTKFKSSKLLAKQKIKLEKMKENLKIRSEKLKIKMKKDNLARKLKEKKEKIKEKVKIFKLQNRYQCDFCYKNTTHKTVFMKHLRSAHHIEEKAMKCYYCNFSFESIYDLKCHIKENYENQYGLDCIYCNRTCKTKYTLYSHYTKVHPNHENPLRSTTKLPHNSTPKVLDHNNENHKRKLDFEETKDSSGNSMTIENISNRKLKSQKSGIEMIKSSNKKIKLEDSYTNEKNINTTINQQLETQCTKCGKTFKNERCLKSHFYRIHVLKEKKKKATVSDIQKCEICLDTFDGTPLLVTHLQNVHGISETQNYICNICNFSTKLLTVLNSHICNPLACNKCSKNFQNYDELVNHNQTVHTNVNKQEVSINENLSSEKLYTCLNKNCTFESKSLEIFKMHSECTGHIKTEPVGHENSTAGGSNLSKTCHENSTAGCSNLSKTMNQKLHNYSKNSNICYICGAILKSQTMLAVHLKFVHKEKVNDLDKLYKEAQLKFGNTEIPLKNMEEENVNKQCKNSFVNLETVIVPEQCSDLKSNTMQTPIQSSSVETLVNNTQVSNTNCEIAKIIENPPQISNIENVHEQIENLNSESQSLLENSIQNSNNKLKLKSPKRSIKKSNSETKINTTPKKFIPNSPPGSPLRCYQCRKPFTNLKELRDHLNEFHDYDNKKFHCLQCTFSSGDRFKFDSHLLVHTDEKNYHCNKCPSKFKAERYLKRHLEVVHSFKSYKCYLCQKLFDKKYKVKFHIETRHKFGKVFKCPKCPYVTSVGFSLRRHSRVHSVHRPYSCSICSIRFKDVAVLRNHQRIVHLKECSIMLYDVRT